jgi:hypothetical protein
VGVALSAWGAANRQTLRAAARCYRALSAALQRGIAVLNAYNLDIFKPMGITLNYSVLIDKEFRGLLQDSCPTKYHDMLSRLLSQSWSRLDSRNVDYEWGASPASWPWPKWIIESGIGQRRVRQHG